MIEIINSNKTKNTKKEPVLENNKNPSTIIFKVIIINPTRLHNPNSLLTTWSPHVTPNLEGYYHKELRNWNKKDQ